MVRFACVVLVDPQGRVLMQERDEHAKIAPEQWGLCGGHLEKGEAEVDGAVRELREETSVDLRTSEITYFGRFEVFHKETGTLDTLAVFAAPTALTDADILVGEGRQIVFVDPPSALELDLTDSAALALPAFLASDLYRELVP
ncbi:MAG: NUDIX hydrolase [Nocardioidaceae bacterium]|nr:NUDIX hydrolase [Nocardioidaceae bacterium]MCL2611807.1 NUDIX hydrolase [Nocardioidaceae bacterium]